MTIDWESLRQLRAEFLSEMPGKGRDYWESDDILYAYDQTFGVRIGWKWDSILGELKALGWEFPHANHLVDFGCGTGVGSRKVVEAFPGAVSNVWLYDRSQRAKKFAATRLEELGVSVVQKPLSPPSPYVLVLSHVMNELESLDEPLQLATSASAILWVEPGTPALSRRLIMFREQLREQFHVVAPCPHRNSCGMLSENNTRHWCHFFAKPHPEAFTTLFWARFSKELKIDLRSLPVSFLVLDRTTQVPKPRARVIGRPRRYTGYQTYLACDLSGVTEKRALKRKSPELSAQLQAAPFTLFLD